MISDKQHFKRQDFLTLTNGAVALFEKRVVNLANIWMLEVLHDGDLTDNLLMRGFAVTFFWELGQIYHLHGKPFPGRPVEKAVDSAKSAAAQ